MVSRPQPQLAHASRLGHALTQQPQLTVLRQMPRLAAQLFASQRPQAAADIAHSPPAAGCRRSACGDIRRSGCLAIFDQHNTRPSRCPRPRPPPSSLSSRYSSPSPALSSSHSMRDVTSHSASVSHLAFVPSLVPCSCPLGADSRLRPLVSLHHSEHADSLLAHQQQLSLRALLRLVSRPRGGWAAARRCWSWACTRAGRAGRPRRSTSTASTSAPSTSAGDEVYSAGVDHGTAGLGTGRTTGRGGRRRRERRMRGRRTRKEQQEHNSVLAVDRGRVER